MWLEGHRRSVIAAAMATWSAGLTSFIVLVVAYDIDFFGPVGGPWVMGFAAFAVTGALITWRRPDHVMGPLFLILGISPVIANSFAAAALGPFAEHSMMTRSLFVAVSVATTSAMFPLLPLVIATFPDGRIPSDRWRWLWAAVAATSVVGATAAFLTGAWGGDPDQAILGPPFGGGAAEVGAALSPIYHAMILGLLTASGIAIVLRYRHSDVTTRKQIKWLMLAVVVLVIAAAAIVVNQVALQAPTAPQMLIVVAVSIGLVPVSVTIAILRHRLLDIDVVINRTIAFGLLAAFITSLYVAIVVGIGTMVGDPSNLLLTVGATALVAVMFEPVRARVQHWANIAVYGRRASPYEVLAQIAQRMGSGSTDDTQLEAMAKLLADGTDAAHATVWVAIEGDLQAAACWPTHTVADHPTVTSSGTAALSADGTFHLEPVYLDGETIGALSMERRRDDPVTPTEQRLIAELAGQASLVLSNARLRARLHARLEELRLSRQRLVVTQDEARRRLERDLHDGAQQQLVALKVKLGMARTIAAKEDAGDTVMQGLGELSATADLAVAALRSLARGIYPPLLEAEGLERAITAQASQSPIGVSVRVNGLQRYSRDIEATVYFCVVEAVGNTVQHAQATAVEILLEDQGEAVAFTIVDDGCGFDPHASPGGLGLKNMADRVDALGGSLTVTSIIGAGVRIEGVIPHAGAVVPASVAASASAGSPV